MNIITSVEQGNVPVTIIRPEGRLDGQSYQALIASATEAYEAGARNILLDLSELIYISSAGIVAFHTMALLLRGEALPDLENGWDALRSAYRSRASGIQKHLKLLNPRPEVLNVLDMVAFTSFLEVFQDKEAALRAF